MEIVDSTTSTPGPGEVVVRARAASINFAETLMRENRYTVTPELSAILGTEVTGTVERLGKDVLGLDAGARVAVPLFAAGRFFGGYAEYVLIDAGLVVHLPEV